MARGKGVGVRFYGDWDGSGVKKAEREIDSAFTRIKKSSLAIGAGFAAGFVGVQALTNGLRDSIAEAQEAIKVNAATAQIIKSTGGAAKVTADQVADLSQRISEQIAVDDELIQQSANLILTFKNIRNEGAGVAAIFDRTVMAAQDLSAAGFGDVESAAKMLGKALNDPVAGLTALRRAGVTFSEEQKSLIKTLMDSGDILAAQKVVLAEVESQVGGVAGATATGIDKFNVYFANLKEELGLAILPFVNALISGLLPAIKGVSSAVQGSSKFIAENKAVIIGATAAVASLTAAMAINRIGGIAFAAQYAIHTITVSAYTAATKLATTATAALSAALKAVPFVAIMAAITGFVMALEDGATEQEKFRKATEGSRRSIDQLKDSTGEYTAEARYLLATNRYSHMAQDRVTKAISGTAASAVAAGEAMGKTLTPETYDAADAAETAAKSYLELWEAIWNTRRAASDLANTSGTVTSALAAGAATGGVPEYWKRLSEAYGETEKSARGAGAAAKESAKGFGDLRKELLASLEDSPAERYAGIIEQLKGNLKSAQDAFTSFKDSVISSITQAFSFGDAYQAAKESGITFLDALKAQAENAVGFAERIKQLVIMGLSPAALQQVLAAGVQAGTGIAKELIEGGATTIEATNRLVETSAAAADEVGQLAASAYFGAGVKSAQDTLDGFAAQLGPDGPSNKRMQRIMDNLAASLRRETTITVTTVHRSVYESMGLPGRAMGGPVSASQAYVVGERGPEVFVPDVAGTIVPNNVVSSPARGGIGGGSINLTVNAGMGTDGAEVGRQIVDALRQYQRRNGPVPIAVA
jgi:hypothetical protein